MFTTSLLDDVPERPSNLLMQVKKGDQVIVCQKDSIVSGHYRGAAATIEAMVHSGTVWGPC